jgi:hypothetical protein
MRRRPPQCNGELMAEKQILNFKPASRLEQIDDQHFERVQDCKHPRKSCDDSPTEANPGRMKFSERTAYR